MLLKIENYFIATRSYELTYYQTRGASWTLEAGETYYRTP